MTGACVGGWQVVRIISLFSALPSTFSTILRVLAFAIQFATYVLLMLHE